MSPTYLNPSKFPKFLIGGLCLPLQSYLIPPILSLLNLAFHDQLFSFATFQLYFVYLHHYFIDIVCLQIISPMKVVNIQSPFSACHIIRVQQVFVEKINESIKFMHLSFDSLPPFAFLIQVLFLPLFSLNSCPREAHLLA